MSSQTLQREIDMVRANRYEVSDDIQSPASGARMSRHQQHQNNAGKNQQLSQQEQFLRSASARLPNNKNSKSEQELDGERKREESMKRLLEWKQRMLQSPLTRKGPQLTVAPPVPPPVNTQSLHLPPKSPLTVQGHQNNWQTMEHPNMGQKSNHALQRSRSDTHAISGYGNEDSSDDEGEFLKLFILFCIFITLSLSCKTVLQPFFIPFEITLRLQWLLINSQTTVINLNIRPL
jgi:hypothetical protein